MRNSMIGARRAVAAAAVLVATTGLVFAHPGFHGGGFGHGGFGSNHGGGFERGGGNHGMFGHVSGMHHASFRHHAHFSHASVSHGHHAHLASHSPAGFTHGKASWKQNGGTPPGWSKGKKTGWHCAPGSSGCKPPGLSKNGT